MITFPWALDAFFGGLKIASATFSLPEAMRIEETQGGEVISAAIGQRLWEGAVQMVPGYHADQAAVEARLALIRDSGRPFYAYPAHKSHPASDPEGLILGASAPTIHALPSARELRLAGLPSGYVLSVGDFLSFDYGSSPVRTALHQLVEAGAANASGITPALEVVPAIRPGAVVGAAVRLVRPFCRAVYVPGSYTAPTHAPMIGSGAGFRFRQTLR